MLRQICKESVLDKCLLKKTQFEEVKLAEKIIKGKLLQTVGEQSVKLIETTSFLIKDEGKPRAKLEKPFFLRQKRLKIVLKCERGARGVKCQGVIIIIFFFA